MVPDDIQSKQIQERLSPNVGLSNQNIIQSEALRSDAEHCHTHKM